MIRYLKLLGLLAALAATATVTYGQTNSLTEYEVDNVSQSNRPLRFGRPFVQGEIAQCPQPLINGTPASSSNWQADVKNRWPDGSIKYAIISLIASLTAAGHNTITFQNTSSCNNTGNLTAATMASFNGGNWDGQIVVSAPGSTTVTVSAKAMLALSDPATHSFGDCGNNFWQKGQVVTAVIIQDCSSAMTSDFGWCWNGSTMSSPATGTAACASFHPMFILYFYPSISAVECEEIIELPWNTKRQDQLADLIFKTEDSSGTLHTRYSHVGARVISSVSATASPQTPPVVTTSTITAAGANFVSTDKGLPICLAANYSSVPSCGTIQSITNSTTAVMANPTGSAGVTSSGLTAWVNLQATASRHRKTFWSGTAPGHVRIDYNFPYLMATKAIPNYDLVAAFINPVNGYYPGGKCCDFGWGGGLTNGWTGTDKGDIGGFGGENVSYSSVLEGAPLRRQELALLYNMSTCGSADSSCAKALQQLTGVTAIGDMSTHAALDSVTTTQFDISGGAGEWDNFGNIPFHWREGQSSSTRNSNNGQGGSANCYYVSQFENKNATQATILNATVKNDCLGGGDGLIADPTGPNDATGRAISAHTHSDAAIVGNGYGGSAPSGSQFPINGGWDVADEGAYHWMNFSYLPYLLTGSPFYLDNVYQSAAYMQLGNTDYNNSAGIFSVYNTGQILRWNAWAIQEIERAAFVAPDGSSDQSYWTAILYSNAQFMEGLLGITGTTVTPSSSQGGFATSGTISSFNPNAATRWDLGRYEAIGGSNSCLGGPCPVISPGLHQFVQGFCNDGSAVPTAPYNTSTAAALINVWMYWYLPITYGEGADMGYSVLTKAEQQFLQFLEGSVLTPTGNPWIQLASYAAPINSGTGTACTAGGGIRMPMFTRYGGATGIYGGFSSQVGQPTSLTRPGNFSSTQVCTAPTVSCTALASPPWGTGNFPGSDHAYSMLAYAAGTFLPTYGINESDADGTYTPAAAQAWLVANVPYFGNVPYVQLEASPPFGPDTIAGSDTQIKFALAPRVGGAPGPNPVPPTAQIIGLNIKLPAGSTATLAPKDANGVGLGTSYQLSSAVSGGGYQVNVLIPPPPGMPPPFSFSCNESFPVPASRTHTCTPSLSGTLISWSCTCP